ncbi:MAG: DUF1513 domain-containing protein [Kiloniellaceae bacterium]
MTAIDRRGFLTATAALFAASGLPWPGGAAAAEAGRYFVNACAAEDGSTLTRIFDDSGHVVATVPLPGRGHGAARRPGRREVVAFARRPEHFAVAFDPLSAMHPRRFDAPEGRHFYGHGVFSRDGRWLFACENDYDNARGCIGVYDASAGYRREGELEATDIGPHELVLLSDGRTLAVANGGIQTHPSRRREKLNIDTMQPSLAYIDSQSGALLEKYRAPQAMHQASIRHLAAAPDDTIGFVMQYEGPRNNLVPLVGFHRRGEGALTLPEAGEATLKAMRQYCGSAAMDVSGRVLAASAPRGGTITFWSVAERRYLGGLGLGDGCGVAASGEPGGFLASSGYGKLVHHNALTGETAPLNDPAAAPVAWDNHMLALTL